jgi:sigma-B regulation protein RsbU (phosphoserine phosphatase)
VAVSLSTAPVFDSRGRAAGGIAAFSDETLRVREEEFARLIQQNILPEPLVGTDIFRLDVHHHPRGLVSSDYYNMIPLEGNRYGILAADVRGKGPSAALYTMLMRNLEEKLAAEADDPSEFVTGLNIELARYMVDDGFTTGVYAVLDADHWILSYCSAGHPPLLHYRAASGTVSRLEAGGLPLGILEAEQFRTRVAILEPGDLVLFYTDGLTESRGSERRALGEDGLAELLRQEVMDTSMDLPKRIYDRVLAFTGEESLDDDALLISLLRRRPPTLDPLSVDTLQVPVCR